MTQERAMFDRMQTGAKVELLSARMNTRKPGTDARYRDNREMRAVARVATLTTAEAVS